MTDKIYEGYEGLSLPLVAWMMRETYTTIDDPLTYSATEMLKPIKELLLAKHMEKNTVINLTSLLASRMGTAIHDTLEIVMNDLELVADAAELLGYSPDVIESILDKSLVIETETRLEKKLGVFTISGEYDLNIDGKVQDYKTMSSYSYMKTNPEKFLMQMSIYRWLNPEVIVDDLCTVHFIIRDFKAFQAKQPNYPQLPMFTEDLVLLSLPEIEAYLTRKFDAIQEFSELTIAEINNNAEFDCTDKQIDKQHDVFKYFANPDAAKSSKNFTDYYLAEEHLASKGKGEIRTVEGQVSGCKFCTARSICNTAINFVERGILD